MPLARYKPPSAGTWLQEKKNLADVFRLWDVADWSASANVPDQLANRSYDSYESDVTVTFVKNGRTVVLTMTTWSYPPTNLKALALCVNDMRMIDRRGVSNTMASAFAQLAGPQVPVKRDPYEVLRVRPDAPIEVIEASYRALAKSAHPDAGGSEAAMAELNAALEDAKGRLVSGR